jgi:hypothetical protein
VRVPSVGGFDSGVMFGYESADDDLAQVLSGLLAERFER